MHSYLAFNVLRFLFQPHVVLSIDTDILHGLYKVDHNVQDQPSILALGRYVVFLESPEDPVEL